MRVDRIFLSKEKKKERIEVDEGMFIANYGLLGDSYSTAGAERQVAILSSRERDSVNNDTRSGLCFHRFLETLRIEGISTDKLEEGTLIGIGDAVFEVTKSKKRCFAECDILKSKETCALVSSVRFLRVIKSGLVKKGDPVEVFFK